jgi:hypothetical protein
VAIVNGYVTRNDVKNALGLGTAALTPEDDEIDQVVNSVSRAIDDACGRFFYSAAGTVLYTAEDFLYLPIDDFSAITAIVIDEQNTGTPNVTLTASTDYRPEKSTAIPGFPYTAIRIASFGTKTFPVGVTEGVSVSGTRGFAAIPQPIIAATLLQCVRTHARRNSPYGVAGSPDGGIIRLLSRLDPDVELMIRPYRRVKEAI